LGHEIPLEVHHVDGDRLNNELNNLQLLCPNCHAQTDNYCGRNIRDKEQQISDDDLLNALRTSSNIKQALAKVGINYSAKSWYEKSYRLMQENNIKFPKKKKTRQKIPKKKITLHQEPRRCTSCGKLLKAKTKGDLCRQCYKFSEERRKVNWPSKEELLNDILTMPIIKVGEKYGVSDSAIRKWCKRYELPYKYSDIKKMRTPNDSA
jgi:transposase